VAVVLRRTLTVGVLVVLCVGVVVGARWDGEAGTIPWEPTEIPESVQWSPLSDLSLVVAVVVAAMSIIAALMLVTSLPKRVLVLVFAACVLLAVPFGLDGSTTTSDTDSDASFSGLVDSVERTINLGQIPIWALIAAVACVAGAGAVVWRLRPQSGTVVEAAQPAPLADALAMLAATARTAGSDDRSVVIATYESLESLLDERGYERWAHETSSEHLGRVLGPAGVDPDDTLELASTYHDAAFGAGSMAISAQMPELRQRAIDAMTRISAGAATHGTPPVSHG
jgi:hypothetical protein